MPESLDLARLRLIAWAKDAENAALRRERRQRAAIAFAFDDRLWNEELTLQRYELLYEAALVEEAGAQSEATSKGLASGRAMVADHRRILATGIARLRSKIKYRPVVFELMRPTFTLLQLQRAVEALAGRLINKPNFRRLVSWKALGVDIRGRSKTLTVNYRTSHQIRQAADRLLPKVVQDVDGVEQDRRGTVSVFNGPEPEIRTFPSADAEVQGIADWIKTLVGEGVAPAGIGLFVRSNSELVRARSAVQAAGHTQLELSERLEEPQGRIAIGTMHLAKGLEYKAIAVMACDDDVLPLQERVETVADEAELDEVYETERHLFYVACTRARDHLLVTGVDPASEFFSDLSPGRSRSQTSQSG